MEDKNIFKVDILGLFIGFVICSGLLTYKHITEPDWYGFPAVTECRLCDKTIWEWQSYERRSYSVKLGGNTTLFGVGASGLVHSDCMGTPDFEIDINIK
jgi:hypothetical protein